MTLAGAPRPFCLLHQHGVTRLAEGEIRYGGLLADMPRPGGTDGALVISMVPYSQLKERGYQTHDDGEPIISLVATSCREIDAEAVLAGPDPEFSVSEVEFDVTREEYADIVRRIVDDEICHGEGSNFLISRRGLAHIDGFSPDVAKAVFRRLVRNEKSAYLTFCFFDGERYFIGASPEQHITFFGDTVTMNPICGTLPKAALHSRADLIEFLTDPKEVNELFQVVDEELKMMSRLCSDGGVVTGPFVKEMSSLIHTEYMLEGRSSMDKVDAFRESMFAATMIGSPLENAARIIARYEPSSRRYYSSAIVLNGLDENGEEYLDSAITIRTMEVSGAGDVILRSGGSIVRDSVPEKEAAEVEAKVAGLLTALRSAEPARPVLAEYFDEHAARILTGRNEHLSRFWTEDQAGMTPPDPGLGKSILIVDNEDEFTRMLGHVLRRLGLTVTIRDHDDPELDPRSADLVLIGPGPGDPTDVQDPKMARGRRLVAELLADGSKFIAVCLGHQMVCQELGLGIVRADPPLQGVQQSVELFGQYEPVGFYNTYFAERPDETSQTLAEAGVEISALADGRVIALRSENFFTFQFHVESVLTTNCVALMRRALEWIL